MVDLKKSRILVTGGTGLIGTHVVENLIQKRGVPYVNIYIPDSKREDVRNLQKCWTMMRDNDIDLVIHLAAKMGGVGYSSKYPATQYYNNILMDLQVMEAARLAGVKKVVLVSSACAYPKEVPYPMTEDNLWMGKPQETNLAYGVGKRIMDVQAEAYRQEFGLNAVVVVPNNSYGPGDNFHPEHSHVIPSLIRRCLSGENPLVVWGDGTPTRDFLYAKDFAEGVICAAEHLETSDPINLGSGTETSIKDLVSLIQELTGHTGKIVFDPTRPNGQPRRSVNVEKAKNLIGFEATYSLRQGLAETISWYKATKKI